MTAAEKRWARDAQQATAREQKARKKVRELQLALRRMETKCARADRLEAAIRTHHREVVHRENWGADDELWAVLRLSARPEDYHHERMAA